jgi:hypothetical protein
VETFAPSVTTIDAVKAWPSESGISADRVKLSKGKKWLKFDVAIREAEDLLRVRPQPGVVPASEIGPTAQITYTLANCNQYITPNCLRALYNMPNGTTKLSVSPYPD